MQVHGLLWVSFPRTCSLTKGVSPWPHPRANPLKSPELRRFLHDIANALNAAKINAYLLRRMHGDVIDKDTVDGLDSSLMDAEKLVAEYHRRVHSEMTGNRGSADATSTSPEIATK